MVVRCFEAVCKQTNRSTFFTQNEKLLSCLWVTYQKNLFSVATSIYYRNQILNSMQSCFEWSLLFFVNSFNLIQVQKQTISFLNMLDSSFFLIFIVSIDKSKFRKYMLTDLWTHSDGSYACWNWMIIAFLWYLRNDLRLEIEKILMASEFCSLMFQVNNLNIEELLQNVELA